MSALVVEVLRDGTWIQIGVAPRLPEGQLDGGATVSHNEEAGRQIYWFACHGEYSVIRRSRLGVDLEAGEMRIVTSVGFEEVARLDADHPDADFWIRTDRMPAARRFRFRHRTAALV